MILMVMEILILTPRTTGTGPTSGFLEVNRDSAVTISFEFADGVVMTESVPVKWNIGAIQFTKDTFLSGDISNDSCS